MNKILQLDLTLIMLLDGYTVYGDAIIIGTVCAFLGVIIAVFCLLDEPIVIPIELVEGKDE